MKQALSIFRKELSGFFSSAMALIFIGAFLAATLFSFFWVDTFFARGISDVRPLFRWMPVLMIFLVAALTMRQWSEEQRSGTLEILLTLPVSHFQLVFGKFLAVLVLVVIALALTLFLPIMVSILGNLDWGPVVGGYLAAVLMAGGYAAIGLFVSSRTDNQIVALISTVMLCGVFYTVGSSGLTEFLPDSAAELLRAFSTGSHFESIERGVIDLRDLIYYLSLFGLFLALNVASIDKKRWSTGKRTQDHRRSVTLTSVLIAINLVVLNIWMFPLRGLRLDLTAQKEYSLSSATRDVVENLQEPLLIRGYFSERTHPLLTPLVPRIRDLLREYEIAAGGKIEIDIIDPSEEPEKEAEANQVYGIRPTPFQVADRYEASVINSYFHVLLRYGDQSIILDYGDLIEVEQRRDDSLDVHFRNLEYDLTRSIKKVVFGFQSVDAVLAALEEPVKLTIFITSSSLPEWLVESSETIIDVANSIQAEAEGKFTFEVVDPDAQGSPINRQDLFDLYGLQPIAVSLFSEESYYLYMLLQVGDEIEVLYPTGELNEADIRTNIEAALKRASPGFLKVVGLWLPPATPTQDIFGNPQQPISSWDLIADQLRRDYEVQSIDLSGGEVPADIDVLVLIGPETMSDIDLYAIDQYLMRGGAVIVAAGNYTIQVDPFSGGLGLRTLEGTLQSMLESYGVLVENSIVMDPQNEPFPVPVTRQVGGFVVQEIELMDYPFFVDVRKDGMDGESPVVSNIPAVTLNWASPLTLDEVKNADRDVTILLRSSANAWLKFDTNIQPDFDVYPESGFAQGGETQSYPLAVSVGGVFESYFKGKPSPLEEGDLAEGTSSAALAGTIETSSASSRLIVIGSMEFLDDVILNLSSNVSGERYFNNLQLVQNAVDWSTEDLELLNIRARGTHARVLKPMEKSEQSLWEGANYAVALLALVGIGYVWNIRRGREEPLF
jgi:ABC-2 type transport system permease protein